MKPNIRRIVLFALSLLMMVPCEAATGIGEHEKKSKAQKYAEKRSKDTMREWGRYEGFSSMDLEGFAAAAARKKLAERVETYIETIAENYQDALGSDGYDERGMAEKNGEAQQRTEGNYKLVADALIRNSWVVMSDRYVQKDGTVVCFVAVEVDIDDIEAGVATSKAMRKAFKEAGIDVDSQEFEDASKNTRKRYAAGKLDLSTL